MVGLVILSHSPKIAEGVRELALEMSPEVPIFVTGGTEDGRLGSDFHKVCEAIRKAYSSEGVIVLFDLGSAFMNGEMAIETLSSELGGSIEMVDAALVEGAITAAVEISLGKSIEQVKESLNKLSIGKIS